MNSNRLTRLRKIYIEKQLLNQSNSVYIDWAISELLTGVEDGNICILASFNSDDDFEIEYYLDKLLADKPRIGIDESYEVIGEIIIKLSNQYSQKNITIPEIDRIINHIFILTDYVDWLVMLARNCEYATDIDVFLRPFEEELDYIADLWIDYNSYSEFSLKYNRKMSSGHDFMRNS